MNIQEEIAQFPIVLEIPVHWGDMDAANHVNNVQYLRWTESARIAFFEKFQIGIAFQKGIAPILAWHDCKYIFPLTYPDTAIVTCGVQTIEDHQFFLECRIFSDQHHRISAISSQRIVPYDYGKLAKAELPEVWKEGLEASEIS